MRTYGDLCWEVVQILKRCMGWILLPIIFLYACRSEEAKLQTANISAWSKLGPGGGGATFFPTFSYKTEEEFLVRCDMTGSYLTKDGGESYHQINFPNGANSFAFDPHDTATIYIGSSSLNRSTDGGKTWDQIFPVKEEIVSEKYEGDHASYSFKTVSTSLYNSENGDINRIKVDPVKKDMLYFSMGKVFYYSNDHGKTFKRKDLQQSVDFIYTNPASLKDEVLIFTANSTYT